MMQLTQILLWMLVAIPFLILLAILAGVAYGAYSVRRSIQVASLTPCPKCGTVIGKDAVLAAKAASSRKMAEARKLHPNIKFRTIADWQISCPHCGATFYFYPVSNTMEMNSRFAQRTS